MLCIGGRDNNKYMLCIGKVTTTNTCCVGGGVQQPLHDVCKERDSKERRKVKELQYNNAYKEREGKDQSVTFNLDIFKMCLYMYCMYLS